MNRKKFLAIFLAEIFLCVISSLAIAYLWDHWFLNGPYGPYRWTGMDFVPFWTGARAMLSGASPYSAAAANTTQQLAYGGPAMNLDPLMFGYPAWIFLVIAPFAILPLKWAVATFAGLLLAALLNLYFFFARQWDKNNLRSLAIWAPILVISGLPFVVISITRGQLGYLGLFALFLSRRLWSRHPFWAGVALSLALVKPTVTVLPTAGFLLWAFLERDWQYWLGFSLSMLILTGSSILAIGNWIPDYLDVLRVSGGLEPLWSLKALAAPWNVLYAAVFTAIAGLALARSRQTKDPQPWLSASILSGIALFPMHWIYDLYLGMIIPSEARELTGLRSIAVGAALLFPWVLIFTPAPARWDMAVVGIPLAWAAAFLALFFCPTKQSPIAVGSAKS